MFNKKGIEANIFILIAAIIGFIILTAVFFLIYSSINLQTAKLELKTYTDAEVNNLDNELYSILFGNTNLDDLIIEGEVLDRKGEIDKEVSRALEAYKDDGRLYSFVINYQGKEKIVYGENLEADYINKIESNLRLPSLKNEFIEVKLITAFSDYSKQARYYALLA